MYKTTSNYFDLSYLLIAHTTPFPHAYNPTIDVERLQQRPWDGMGNFSKNMKSSAMHDTQHGIVLEDEGMNALLILCKLSRHDYNRWTGSSSYFTAIASSRSISGSNCVEDC